MREGQRIPCTAVGVERVLVLQGNDALVLPGMKVTLEYTTKHLRGVW